MCPPFGRSPRLASGSRRCPPRPPGIRHQRHGPTPLRSRSTTMGCGWKALGPVSSACFGSFAEAMFRWSTVSTCTASPPTKHVPRCTASSSEVADRTVGRCWSCMAREFTRRAGAAFFATRWRPGSALRLSPARFFASRRHDPRMAAPVRSTCCSLPVATDVQTQTLRRAEGRAESLTRRRAEGRAESLNGRPKYEAP